MPMRPSVDDEFVVLAERVSQDAARIDCSPAEYRDGLTTIIEQLQIDKRASEETSGGEDTDE